VQKILIHGESTNEIMSISSVLEANMSSALIASNRIERSIELVSQDNFNLLVFECGKFDSLRAQAVQQFRASGYNQNILLVTEEVDHLETFIKNQTKNRIHLLMKPVSEKDLFGLSKKLIHSRKIPQQVFKRFRTDQSIKVEPLLKGDAFVSKMFNLSKGGAYFEFNGEIPLGTGDLLRLHIPLMDVSKSHVLNGRVVWTTRAGKYTGQGGIGVRFLNAKDTHRHLLEKI
jgi:Tfp pilus assembly protein PilZ